MPRYLVERCYSRDIDLPAAAEGARAFARIVAVNGECGVTWLHSYVSADRRRIFCIYDAPAPEAIRHVARRNALPVTQIVQVCDLSPYAHC